jgi:hypothetical protein
MPLCHVQSFSLCSVFCIFASQGFSVRSAPHKQDRKPLACEDVCSVAVPTFQFPTMYTLLTLSEQTNFHYLYIVTRHMYTKDVWMKIWKLKYLLAFTMSSWSWTINRLPVFIAQIGYQSEHRSEISVLFHENDRPMFRLIGHFL